MRRYRTVAHDLRYQLAPQLKCSALGHARQASRAASTLEVLPGHK
jgi:hypothetical protein